MRSARTTSIGYITPADTMQPALIGASVVNALGGDFAAMMRCGVQSAAGDERETPPRTRSSVCSIKIAYLGNITQLELYTAAAAAPAAEEKFTFETNLRVHPSSRAPILACTLPHPLSLSRLTSRLNFRSVTHIPCASRAALHKRTLACTISSAQAACRRVRNSKTNSGYTWSL